MTRHEVEAEMLEDRAGPREVFAQGTHSAAAAVGRSVPSHAVLQGIQASEAQERAARVSASAPTMGEMIDKITSRVSSQLRVELEHEIRDELAREAASREMQQQVVQRSVEGSLASEIASHTCPVCMELMLPPARTPTLLFPCGHTFCVACLATPRTGGDTCPLCRAGIQSRATNVSLQQIIANYAQKEELASQVLRRGGAGGGAGGAPPDGLRDGAGAAVASRAGAAPPLSDTAEGYRRDLRGLRMRIQILKHEVEECLEGASALDAKVRGAGVALQGLGMQEEVAAERLREAQADLAAVQEQVAAQRRAKAALEDESAQARQQCALVQATLAPLVREREKIEVILQGLGVDPDADADD